MAGRALLLVAAAAALVGPAPASTPGTSIANPDFPCGEPYGPNGEPPQHHRVARQIILPHDPKYQEYLRVLLLGYELDTVTVERQGEIPNLKSGFCGASLISDHFVLTTAHCADQVTDKIRLVSLGDPSLPEEGGENSTSFTYEIASVIVHPDFSTDKITYYNDVALLRTKQKIQFNDLIFPYCISDQITPPGANVIISSFGLYSATNVPQQEANFTVIDNAECEEIYRRENYESILRINYPNLLQGSDITCATHDELQNCEGNSGRPVLREEGGKLFLEGVLSGGSSCHKSVLPSMYVSLAEHIDFLNEHVYGSPVVP